MNTARLNHVIMSVLAFSLVGCSIKESREECPSYLSVIMKANENVSGSAKLLGWTSEEVFNGEVEIKPEDCTWVRAVHKDLITLSALAGNHSDIITGHHLEIPYGHQADSLFAFHQVVDCTGEEAFAEVVFRKQFCTIHLDINQSASALKRFRFEVDGNVSGFDLLDFSVSEGPFHFEPSVTPGERVVDFRIPRQKDASMTVKVFCLPPQKSASGPSLTAAEDYIDMGVFALGEYIERTGYDWAAEALQDIYVRIDFVGLTVTVSVAGWEDGVTYTLVEQ